MVCSPEKESEWTDTDFLLRKVVNPICHGISIAILLTVAVVYFVVPSLRYDLNEPILKKGFYFEMFGFFSKFYRDLVGNIITTMACCLIVGQIANLMRIYTEFHNHINFLIMGMSLLCNCCYLNVEIFYYHNWIAFLFLLIHRYNLTSFCDRKSFLA